MSLQLSPSNQQSMLSSDIQEETTQDATGSNTTSPQTSPSEKRENLSPCAIETIKRVDSLKKDFQAKYDKIEKSIKTSPSSTPHSEDSLDACNDSTIVNERHTMTEPPKETVKPVKVQKELFKEGIKPQRKLEANSRLLVGTRSNSAKRAVPVKRAEHDSQNNSSSDKSKPRCASTGVRRRPTQPQAPTFMSRASRPSNIKFTSEEMELQKVEREKQEAEKLMKRFQKTFQVLKSKGAIPTTVRSVKELTIPMTPSFATEGRKRHDADNPHEEEKKVHTVQARTGPTIPAPFHFATTKRYGEFEKSHDEELSCRESIENFSKNCRSSYVPAKTPTGVTKPQAPCLRTEQRSNSVGRPKPLSRDEIEEREMKEAQALSFKAKPVNKRIFDSMGVNGVPKVQVKEPTVFSEFHLSSEDRAAYRKSQIKSESTQSNEKSCFKALAMPDFSKTSTRPRTPCNRPKLTEAHSPKLSGGQRSSSAPARRQKPPHEEVEKRKLMEANEWKQKLKEKPHLTCPIDVHLKTTERGNASQQSLHERIHRQMLEEKKATEVHATPFNEKIFKNAFSVSASQKNLTEFSEFKLKTDERHSQYHEATMKSMEKMQQDVKKMAEFHARPLPSTTHHPGFTPAHSEKEPVTPRNIHLNSEQRAQQRKCFDAAVYKARQDEKDLREQQKVAKQEKENIELQRLRRTPVSEGGMLFKASEVMTKDPYRVKHVNSNPLTEPISPNLRTALRTRVNEQ